MTIQEAPHKSEVHAAGIPHKRGTPSEVGPWTKAQLAQPLDCAR